MTSLRELENDLQDIERLQREKSAEPLSVKKRTGCKPNSDINREESTGLLCAREKMRLKLRASVSKMESTGRCSRTSTENEDHRNTSTKQRAIDDRWGIRSLDYNR